MKVFQYVQLMYAQHITFHIAWQMKPSKLFDLFLNVSLILICFVNSYFHFIS
jgi:hypothetical protein